MNFSIDKKQQLVDKLVENPLTSLVVLASTFGFASCQGFEDRRPEREIFLTAVFILMPRGVIREVFCRR